jgi:hypothetical protein
MIWEQWSSASWQIASWCEGLKGDCEICLVLEKMTSLDKMMKDCGMDYSNKGDMTICQGRIFIGIIFNTLLGRLRFTV